MSEIPTGDWSWINEVADRFERAWNNGSPPRIEDFLANEPEPRRPPLLVELLRVECELRANAGERPTAEEYHRRFPEYSDVVALFLRRPPLQSAEPSLSPAGASRRNNRRPTSLGKLPAELANHRRL